MADEKKPGFFKRIASGIKRFFKDSKGEMKKIVWPSKKQFSITLELLLSSLQLSALALE